LPLLGHEKGYTFVATTTEKVLVTASQFSWYPVISVLERVGTGTSATCNPNECVAQDFYSVDFDAVAGKTYDVVFEGWQGTDLSYEVSVVCSPPATETSCADGIDNDGDWKIDCDDPDCASAPACQP
jgi:hypothetical protein